MSKSYHTFTHLAEGGEFQKKEYFLYELDDLDKLGKGGAERVLFKKCENELKEAVPNQYNQGILLSDIESGVKLNDKSKQILSIENESARFQMTRLQLKD